MCLNTSACLNIKACLKIQSRHLHAKNGSVSKNSLPCLITKWFPEPVTLETIFIFHLILSLYKAFFRQSATNDIHVHLIAK